MNRSGRAASPWWTKGGLALGPAAMVLLLQFSNSMDPSGVFASGTIEDPASMDVRTDFLRPDLNKEQQIAADEAASLGPIRGTPMLVVQGLEEAPMPIPGDALPVKAPRTSDAVRPPRVKVSSVMNAPGGAVAAINGEVVRVGHDLGGGWRVERVDARARLVTLAHPSGRRLEVATGQSLN